MTASNRGPTTLGWIVAGAIALAVAGCGEGSAPTPVTDVSQPPEATPPTATATAEIASFKPIKLSGRGSKVAKFSIPEDAPAIATITNKGASNFAVESIATDGSTNDLLVNEIGNFSGTVLFDESVGQHSVAFKVTSSGTWTITIKPVTAARVWNPATKLTGKGDDVVQLQPAASGLMTLTISHAGASNFAVIAYGPGGSELLVNEIGRYSGQVLLPDGALLLSVEADGSWTGTVGS